jgi:hypothetical protein
MRKLGVFFKDGRIDDAIAVACAVYLLWVVADILWHVL